MFLPSTQRRNAMTTPRSALLQQRLAPFDITLVRTTGTAGCFAAWLLQKPDPVVGRPWHMGVRTLDEVEEIVAAIERQTQTPAP
jgi:hypothetical protein